METSVFLSNRSQAVRLPEAVALPENVKRVEVIAVGEPGSSRRPENPGMNGSTGTTSAPILWITGNNPRCRKGGLDLTCIRNHPPAPHPPPGPGER